MAGLLTAAVLGLLLALVFPVVGFFFCCCRCAGKCGAYPKTHYDKKSDSCKRVILITAIYCILQLAVQVTLGVLLSVFVIAVVFGTVSAFVTNYYSYSGWQGISKKVCIFYKLRILKDGLYFDRQVDASLEDTGGYFLHTGESLETLLVTNFAEMEEVIGDILDDSGPILKRKLAAITEAIAIDDLTAIVSGLGRVKGNLKTILSDTETLSGKVT